MSRAKPLAKSRVPSRKKAASEAPRRQAPPLSGGKLAALCLLLAAVTVAVYSPAIGHSFVVLDDREYVTANPHIRSLGWETVKWAFTSTDAANWHPLTWLSHAVDYGLFGLSPAGHHLDSVLIHALNAVLLFLLLYWLTKRTGLSLLVAALFAVHPLNVESVAWVAERKNVLSTLFFLLALGAYAWYARKPDWRRYLLVVALFGASLMAKPMAVTFPFVLLLMDYWPLGRMRFSAAEGTVPNRSGAQPAPLLGLVLEKVPLLLLSAASSWITMKAQRGALQTFQEFSLANRLGNAVVAYGLYLWKMVWPAQLALYPHPLGSRPAWQVTLCAVVLLAVTALVLRFPRERYLPVGWFWFLGTLVPVLGLVQVGGYAMADRYAYIPLIGIFIMLVWGFADLQQAKHVPPTFAVVVVAGILVALAGATVHQIGYWDSDYALNSHMLAVAETPFAHDAIGMTLMNPSAAMTPQELEEFPSEPARIDEARRHFERALQLRQSERSPATLWDQAGTLNNLGNLDRMENRLSEARVHDEAALDIYRQLARENPDRYLPYLAVTLNNLGAVNRLQNLLEEASLDYEESLSINRQLAREHPDRYLPNVALVLNEYALVDAGRNRPEAAMAHYEEALRINRQLAEQSPAVYLPQLAMTLTNLGLFEAFQHRMDDARGHFEEALKIDRQLVERNSAVYLPDLAMTLSNLGRLDQLQGRFDESRAHYEEAHSLLQKLAHGNSAYKTQLARVETGLAELKHLSSSPQTSATAPAKP